MRMQRCFSGVLFLVAVAGCGNSGPDCSQYSSGGKLTFAALDGGAEGCPTLGPLDRTPPAEECTPGCTCTLSGFAQHEEEADWFGGSSSYDCRSRFEQVCDTDGTHLICNLIVGNSTQASDICRLTSNQKDANWFCDYRVTLELE